MSATAIVFVAIYFTGVFLTFRHPYFGIATYVFEWHNHPPYMWWGESLPDLRWAMLISVVTLISMFINHGKLKPLKNQKFSLIWWLVAFTLWMYFITFFYALDPEVSLRKSEIFFKLTIQIFMMMYLIRTFEHYKVVIWVILFGVANFGRISFQSGSNRDLGVIAPNATEENAVSAHVAAITPFFGLYFLFGRRWEKIVSILSLPFLINLIILANSRASFLALVVIGLLALIWVRGRLRWRVLLGEIGGILLVLILANDQFWNRQATIHEYEDEGSAMSRFYLWNGALKMWADHPMGIGGDGYQTLVIDYVPELAEQMQEEGEKTVHNTFLLILVEWGVVGSVIYFGFLVHTLLIFLRIKRDALRAGSTRFYVEAIAIMMGLIGILSAGMFHNRLYSEVVYWFAAFAVALRNIQKNEMLEEQEEESDEIGEIPDTATA